MKTAVGDELAKANRIIKDRNSEIALLKGMVRTTQTTMKNLQKDTISQRGSKPSSLIHSPNRSMDIRSSLTLAIEYIFELKEIEDWVDQKRDAFTTDTMDADEIGKILGEDVKGTGVLNVGQVLADIKGTKIGQKYRILESALREADEDIQVQQLKKRANYPKLDAILGDTPEEMLSCEEVLAILERL